MWPESSRTQELIQQAQRGDAGAVDELLARHREPIRRMIGLRLDRAVAPRVDASDVVQDVLLEASKRLAEYLRDPSMPFHLWLRCLAQDRVIDAHRRHRKAQRRSVDKEKRLHKEWADRSSMELAGQLIDRELTPATAALRHELEGRFQEVLEELADDDREIILMRHFEQLSNQEVAQSLGLTEAAAGMWHLRALRRLKTLLEPKDRNL